MMYQITPLLMTLNQYKYEYIFRASADRILVPARIMPLNRLRLTMMILSSCESVNDNDPIYFFVLFFLPAR